MNRKEKRFMLVFDSAYTYEMMIQRNLSVLVTSRDLEGYFDHIWTVHPVASIVLPPSSLKRYGAPQVYQLNERHTIIEGKLGRYKGLSWLAPLNFFLAQVQLLKLLLRLMRQNKMKFIRAEDPHYNGLLGLFISALKKKPLLIGVWGNPGAVRKYTKRPLTPRLFKWIWLEELIEKFVLKHADIVMVQNEDNRNFVLSKNVKYEHTAIFRVGNVIHKIHFVEPSKRDDGSSDLHALGVNGYKTLMCISRLEALKLTDHVIQTVACLKNMGHNVKALFIGDGTFRPAMISLAEELGVTDNIVFCGNRDQQWLGRVIPKVSVIISPLTGRAMAEAALGGAPIVAYDIDWHREVIETGVTGELVPYLEYKQMAIAIERILNNKKYGEHIGSNVRKRMLNMMDPKINNEDQIAVYTKLATHSSVL